MPTVTLRCASGNDIGWQPRSVTSGSGSLTLNTTGFTRGSATSSACYDSTTRFTAYSGNLPPPQGSTINSAYWRVNPSGSTAPHIDIRAHKMGRSWNYDATGTFLHAGAFVSQGATADVTTSTHQQSIANRRNYMTSNVTSVNTSGVSTAGYYTPHGGTGIDVTSVIQEVVDMPGYDEQAITLIINGSNTSGDFGWQTWNGTNPPELVINYTEPAYDVNLISAGDSWQTTTMVNFHSPGYAGVHWLRWQGLKVKATYLALENSTIAHWVMNGGTGGDIDPGAGVTICPGMDAIVAAMSPTLPNVVVFSAIGNDLVNAGGLPDSGEQATIQANLEAAFGYIEAEDPAAIIFFPGYAHFTDGNITNVNGTIACADLWNSQIGSATPDQVYIDKAFEIWDDAAPSTTCTVIHPTSVNDLGGTWTGSLAGAAALFEPCRHGSWTTYHGGNAATAAPTKYAARFQLVADALVETQEETITGSITQGTTLAATLVGSEAVTFTGSITQATSLEATLAATEAGAAAGGITQETTLTAALTATEAASITAALTQASVLAAELTDGSSQPETITGSITQATTLAAALATTEAASINAALTQATLLAGGITAFEAAAITASLTQATTLVAVIDATGTVAPLVRSSRISRLLPLNGTLTHVDRTNAVSSQDEYGDPVETSTTTLVACWVDDTGTQDTETEGLAQVATEGLRLFLEPGVAVDADDRIQIGPRTYEIWGVPWEAVNPKTGVASHIEATVRRSS